MQAGLENYKFQTFDEIKKMTFLKLKSVCVTDGRGKSVDT